jgi:hypothetical protein
VRPPVPLILLAALLAPLACRATAPSARVANAPAAALPADNPTRRHGLPWTERIRWTNVVSIERFGGATADARFAAAQRAVRAAGGGVVYFPAGEYRFEDSIALESGVVIRGAPPHGETDAKHEAYAPPTVFRFPRYVPTFEGAGTPIASAFKGIHVADPAATADVGVVDVTIDHGHVAFEEAADHRAGRNRLVSGCVVRNAAVAARDVPDVAGGQLAWQRFTDRYRAAIRLYSGENLLVANNRVPASDASFVMRGYVLPSRGVALVPPEGVEFDYDDRPGITANEYQLGGDGPDARDGTPESHPHGFRKGTVIRDNYVFSTGRAAIAFSGDGVVCAHNVIRFKKAVRRWTVTGRDVTTASSSNGTRAIQMRGWRWSVEGNDFEVWRNLAADGTHFLDDGEGLLHEDHANSTVVGSRLVDNRGNAPLAVSRTGGVDGLLVQGNDVRTGGGPAAIYVVASRNEGKYPVRNVAIVGNVTGGSGIRLAGDPSENNVIKGNSHIGVGGLIKFEGNPTIEDNDGYSAERMK